MPRFLLCLLALVLLPLPLAKTEDKIPASIDASDFAVKLPDGSFNLVTDDREDLERITGQEMEFYDEFPELEIAYQRLLTDAFDFFTGADPERIEQVRFKQGCVTARGISYNSTQAEVFAAYGEPRGWFDEHGYIRCEYEAVIADAYSELFILLNVSKDRVIDIRLACKREQRPAF